MDGLRLSVDDDFAIGPGNKGSPAIAFGIRHHPYVTGLSLLVDRLSGGEAGNHLTLTLVVDPKHHPLSEHAVCHFDHDRAERLLGSKVTHCLTGNGVTGTFGG